MRRAIVAAVTLSLAVIAIPVFAARPTGSTGAPSAMRGGGKSYAIYLKSGQVLRAKRRPVSLYGRCVFTTPEGKPMNIDLATVDVARTNAGVEETDLKGTIVTNRELRMGPGRGVSVEIGSLDAVEDDSSRRRRESQVEAAGEQEGGAADRPAGRGPDAAGELRSAQSQKLQREKSELSAQLQRLEAQRRETTDPTQRQQIEADIARVRGQLSELSGEMSTQGGRP